MVRCPCRSHRRGSKTTPGPRVTPSSPFSTHRPWRWSTSRPALEARRVVAASLGSVREVMDNFQPARSIGYLESGPILPPEGVRIASKGLSRPIPGEKPLSAGLVQMLLLTVGFRLNYDGLPFRLGVIRGGHPSGGGLASRIPEPRNPRLGPVNRLGLTPAGPEGRDASRPVSGALGMAPSAGAVATRGNVPVAGEFRLEPLGLSPLRPPTAGGIPVVLVHGLWGSPRMWEPMVKALEADSASERAIPVLDLRLFRGRLDPSHGLPAASGAADPEGSARSRPAGSVVGPHGPHRA